MPAFLIPILIYILGELGQMFIAFVENLTKGEPFNQAIADAARTIVSSMEESTLFSGAEKKDGAIAAIKAWHADNSIATPSDSVLNTLVELAVQKLKKS